MSKTSVGIAISSNQLRGAIIHSEHAPEPLSTWDINSEIPVEEQIRSYLSGAVSSNVKCSALCIAVPGMVERNSGAIVDSRVPALAGIELAGSLQDACSENVFVENDANAAAFAEFEIGAGKGSLNIFCAILGEGVGSGLILNGEIWRGHKGFAGELGAIIVDAEENTRLEDIASMSNIVRRTRNRFHQDSTSTLNKLREENITFEDILSAADLGDDFARLMLDRTGTYVGSAVACVINLLNVEKVILAGEVLRGGRFVLDAVVDRARECTSSRAFNSTEIVLSSLDENAAAFGAALIAAKSIS